MQEPFMDTWSFLPMERWKWKTAQAKRSVLPPGSTQALTKDHWNLGMNSNLEAPVLMIPIKSQPWLCSRVSKRHTKKLPCLPVCQLIFCDILIVRNSLREETFSLGLSYRRHSTSLVRNMRSSLGMQEHGAEMLMMVWRRMSQWAHRVEHLVPTCWNWLRRIRRHAKLKADWRKQVTENMLNGIWVAYLVPAVSSLLSLWFLVDMR